MRVGVLLLVWLASFAEAGEVDAVSVCGTAVEGYQIFVADEPFEIRGVGGEGSKELLRDCGGNSFRTWKIDENTEALLDEAERLGLKVTLGFWLGHERHGFSYESYEQVAKQEEELRIAVEKYKGHPALLMWALGNEMEGYESGDSPAIWTQIEHLARVLKALDPHHPVMTVTAEIEGGQVRALNRFCPSVDIHGINSYGGITTLAKRYREAGGKKPYVVTEFGPPGSWELEPGKWGMPKEKTSTEKADFYGTGYMAAAEDPLCLGSYAFTWGAKQEATATWFGMLLPTGERLEAVDALAEMWTGREFGNRCPQVRDLKLIGGDRLLDPGAEAVFSVKTSDREGDTLSAEWRITEDWKEQAEGGDIRPAPPAFPKAILSSGPTGAKIRLPENGGTYRVYATVRDGHGGAATASLSIKVKGSYQAGPSAKVNLPFSVTSHYVPSGWMGDTNKMKLTLDSMENPRVGDTCIKLAFTEPAGWGGIAWLSPAGDWGDQPGGYNLTGAETLSFWARGSKGGETASFGFGLIESDKSFFDTDREEIAVKLSSEWKKYEIDLKEKDLARIKSGFYIVVASKGLPFEFFVDEVVIE